MPLPVPDLHARTSHAADRRKARVCFSLPFATQLLDVGTDCFGGAELRGVTFLKGIGADRALDVHVVVVGAARPPVRRADGITVHFRPHVSFYEGHQDDAARSVWAAVDADVYVAFGANEATAELARFCRAHGSALVVSLASDLSLQPYVYEGSTERDSYAVPGHYVWYGMHHADEIVVQSERQRDLVRDRLHRDATLIRNPAPAGVRSAPRDAVACGGRMLWIGRIDPNKRYTEALALAAALPHRPMIMVCNDIRSLGAGQIDELQSRLPNLMLAEQVALPDIDALFRFSDVLVNTSLVEGFPNTFLQAGMHGIPVVSMLVDPDRMLSDHECGRVADGTRDDLARCVDTLLADPAAYRRAAAANSQWVRSRHAPAERIADLHAVLTRALATHVRHAPARAV